MIDEKRMRFIQQTVIDPNTNNVVPRAVALELGIEVERLRSEVEGWAAFATARNEEIAGLRAVLANIEDMPCRSCGAAGVAALALEGR